ncbi:MAG: permease-like cell division protein FtsX [bacterium]
MFKRAFLEGVKNIVRSFWLAATAVTVLTVSLASVTLVATLSTVVGYAVRNLDNLISIPAFVQESVSDDQIPGLTNKLQTIPDVKSVKYYDKEAANQALREGVTSVNLDFAKSQVESDKNLVFRFYLITPKNSESYGKIIETLKGVDFQDYWKQKDVVGDVKFIDNLISFNSWVRIIGVVLILIFALISILVMSNIIRITIYSHKDEIEIMRLVGATNGYIRAPFIAEGILFNLISAFIVSLVFVPGFNIILPNVANWINGANVSANAGAGQLMLQTYGIFGATLVGGLVVGGLTSYFATQRYLKL